MGRTKEQQAAYMRDYRARRRLSRMVADQTPEQALVEARSFVTDYVALYNDTARERDVLREEVKRLKRELARRGASVTSAGGRVAIAPMGEARPVQPMGHEFNTRPFTPVPKKAHGRSLE